MSNAFFNFDELYLKGGNKRFKTLSKEIFSQTENNNARQNAEIFKLLLAMS